jgi:hypothetical protein
MFRLKTSSLSKHKSNTNFFLVSTPNVPYRYRRQKFSTRQLLLDANNKRIITQHQASPNVATTNITNTT